jgi:hypothetical protein
MNLSFLARSPRAFHTTNDERTYEVAAVFYLVLDIIPSFLSYPKSIFYLGYVLYVHILLQPTYVPGQL